LRPTTCRWTPSAPATRDHILGLPEMVEWTAAAHLEAEEVEELEVEF
jgi:hypothetical protein